MMNSPRVLFVDDDPAWLHAIERRLRRSNPGWEVAYASSGAQALETLQNRPIDVVVSDLNMPGIRGDALLSQIAETWPDILLFILSGTMAADCRNETDTPGVEFIEKASADSDLLYAIACGVTLRRFIRRRTEERLIEIRESESCESAKFLVRDRCR